MSPVLFNHGTAYKESTGVRISPCGPFLFRITRIPWIRRVTRHRLQRLPMQGAIHRSKSKREESGRRVESGLCAAVAGVSAERGPCARAVVEANLLPCSGAPCEERQSRNSFTLPIQV